MAQPRHVPRLIGRLRLPCDRRHIDPDRKDLRPHDAAKSPQRPVAEILAARPAQQIVAEAVEVRLGLKPDEIVGAQPFGDVVVVGQHAQQFGGRERRVQEEADRLHRVQPAQFLAERDQMVVVDPDEILRRQHRSQGARKHPIDAQIACEIAPGKLNQRAAKMK